MLDQSLVGVPGEPPERSGVITSPDPAANIFGWSRLDDKVLLADASLAMAMASAGADCLIDLRAETKPPRLPITIEHYPIEDLMPGQEDLILAAELYADNIAVNALSPNKVVPTPGTVFHHLTTDDNPNAEPPAVMAEAALVLCSRDPHSLTGRITYSQDLLTELGVATPSAG